MIFVQIADLPHKVRGFTLEDDCDYIIVINARLSHEQQVITYRHEFSHIRNGDFDAAFTADAIEAVGHHR